MFLPFYIKYQQFYFVISFIISLGELVVYYLKCKGYPCVMNSKHPLKVQDDAN